MQNALPKSATYLLLALTPWMASANNVVDSSTLHHKFMLGYQGWFSAAGDGSKTDRWLHWSKDHAKPAPDNVAFEMWPDLREFGANELYPTSLTLASGQPAQLYSAYNDKTVLRHFQWMHDYGIDGVFLQRFLSDLTTSEGAEFRNQVTKNVASGAQAHGRIFAIMYDISGAAEATFDKDLIQDWKLLVDQLKVTGNKRYLHHRGRPLLAIWGLGFKDRPGSPEQAERLIQWLTRDAPEKYRVTLMGGIPRAWRLGNSSQVKDDPRWSKIFRSFSVISPWAVTGKKEELPGNPAYAEQFTRPDLAEAKKRGFDYMPVVYPGFSWSNLKPGAKFNVAPREGGRFLWRQIYHSVHEGSSMIYGAMFDEVDEGTALFKIAETRTQVPAQGRYLTLDEDGERLPSDWYLRLIGQGTKMLRRETHLTSDMPSQSSHTSLRRALGQSDPHSSGD